VLARHVQSTRASPASPRVSPLLDDRDDAPRMVLHLRPRCRRSGTSDMILTVVGSRTDARLATHRA